MSSSRTPSHKSVSKKPSVGSSFTRCFGATVPVSPQRSAGGQALLASQAGVNYRRLRFDEFADEDRQGRSYGCRSEEYPEQRYPQDFCRQGATMKLGKQSSFKERLVRREIFYASEGEQERGRERRGILKIGKQKAMKEIKAGSGRYSASDTFKKHDLCESEAENYEHTRQRRSAMQGTTREKAEMGYDDLGSRERGELGFKKGSSKREKAMEGAEAGDSPRRASFGARMREACVQVLETARRGSPHLSELFVGNQLLMQVTASAFNTRHSKNMAPSYGFRVCTGDPTFSVMMSSPAHSTSSAF